MTTYVGLWSANSALHLELPEELAACGLGLVALPTDCPAPVLQHYVRVAGLKALLCDAAHFEQASRTLPDMARVLLQADTMSADVMQQLRVLGLVQSQVTQDPLLERMLFSSGTDGLPKAVLRSAQADAYRMQQFTQRFHLHAGMRHIVAGPLYHSGPAIFARTHRALGCEILLQPHFDAAAVLNVLASTAERVFTLFLVPTQLRKLEQVRAALNLPWSVYDTVARLWVAGSHFDADLKELFARQLAPGTLWEFYGATETGTITIQSQAQMLLKPGSVGRPVAGVDVQVRDARGLALPAGQTGRLWVHSPMNATASIGGTPLERDPTGALCLGDHGWIDAQGDLYVRGREADMMISGGVNVYPTQVETALRSLEGIADALAYSLPDHVWGERIEALVVATGNLGPIPGVENELRNRLPAAARPKALHWVLALPQTASGKPSRQAARKLAKNLL